MKQSMMRFRGDRIVLGALCLVLAGVWVGCNQATAPREEPAANTPAVDEPAEPASETEPADEVPAEPDTDSAAATDGAEAAPPKKTVELMSCDGENTATVEEDLRGAPLARELMGQWRRIHPDRDWVEEEKAAHAIQPPADNSAVLEGEQGEGHAYGSFTERDLLIWARETERLVVEGSRIFHSPDELGSTVAVSCDMCHPDGANTHPETYPKYQTQLGRAALLRDMINWCMENPVRAEPLDPDGPKMRAIEAYIMAQRKGVEMNYGKH